MKYVRISMLVPGWLWHLAGGVDRGCGPGVIAVGCAAAVCGAHDNHVAAGEEVEGTELGKAVGVCGSGTWVDAGYSEQVKKVVDVVRLVEVGVDVG